MNITTDLVSPELKELLYVEMARLLIKSESLSKSRKLMNDAFNLSLRGLMDIPQYDNLKRIYESQELTEQVEKYKTK